MDDMRYTQPAEWAPHVACWTAYPYDPEQWLDDLRAAQDEFVAMCRHIGNSEPLHILVPTQKAADRLRTKLRDVLTKLFVVNYGDIWLRDTGPIFVLDAAGKAHAGCFKFNGWGGKYVMGGDSEVSGHMAKLAERGRVDFNFILEGGSIESDGEGTCLTSRQCLLNPNRNGKMDQAAVEQALHGAVGADRVLWASEGLRNDHTDGHIDTIARFVEPGHVVCMAPSGNDDPNGRALQRIFDELSAMVDAKGRPLKVSQVPSPGGVFNRQGDLMPASFLNFYIGNNTVVVPTYGTPYDDAAVAQIGALFAERRTVGSPASAILTGGGAFHCMTQQEPV